MLQLRVPRPRQSHLRTQLPLLDLFDLRLEHDIVNVVSDDDSELCGRGLLLELGTTLGCQELAKFYHFY